MDFNTFVRNAGFDPETLNEAQRAFFTSQFRAQNRAESTIGFAAGIVAGPNIPSLQPTIMNVAGNHAGLTSPTQNGPTQSVRDIAIAEHEAVARVNQLCKGYPDVAAKALKNNWDESRITTELELVKLRAAYSTGPESTVPNVSFTRGAIPQNVNATDVYEAALAIGLHGRAITKAEKHYKPDALQYARDQFPTGVSLQQLLITFANFGGLGMRAGDRITSTNLRSVLRAAFDPRAEGYGGANVSGILSNLANKELLMGYMEENQDWRKVSKVKPVNDFKVHTSYRMLANMKYEKIPAGGKIKYGTVSEEKFERSAASYAKMFSLTRENIINDDLGAFNDVREHLARGAAQAFNELFWTVWLADVGTFWTSGQGNYYEGADSNLGVDGVGLGKVLEKFRTMKSPKTVAKDDGGKLLNRTPKTLLVPPTLESAAMMIYKNTNLGAVSNSGGNLYAGLYEPVTVPYLNDSAYTGYSATAWWLLCDPNIASAVVVSFLNGNETPIVETSDADFDELGIQMRGYHDFGVDKAEPLVGVRSKGTA